MSKNKYLIVLAGMIMQLSIGSIYAYSKWIEPLTKELNWDAHDTKTGFSLAICFLGLTAAFMGKFAQKIGPMKSGLIAALFLTIGLLGSALAVKIDSMSLFYLTYGVLQGIGLGFGYIAPVYTVVKWFPDRPGLASGIIIMSFALGSLLASFLIGPLYTSMGLSGAFTVLGIGYGICMLLSALYLANPMSTAENEQAHIDLTPKQIVTDRRFIALWLLLFLNVCGGIAIISKAAVLGEEVVGMTTAQATIFVAIIGLFNGIGRLFWSSISDKIGCWSTFMIFIGINAICFALIPTFSTNQISFQTLTFIIIAGYGAGFATMPSFVKSIFGAEKYGQVLGYTLTAWSAAGFAGPLLLGLTADISIFYLFAVLLLFALFVGLWLKTLLLKPVTA
ncbi:OFA family MFS transporter [Flavobacterium aquicola]|uniref:OFA family oxalate/formate antiporter-like MFS transporter n=1 Tax=Flavobacterium aquicola TaxID=1682742 RepID=A0A3E0EQX8_9FLAO|nr:OFA family MFS transporter [Flavobacterium aquicola]REG99556.1 OFA family oxalate/formate antiporter-like MFS transporter [Flavobacterium aquicola]